MFIISLKYRDICVEYVILGENNLGNIYWWCIGNLSLYCYIYLYIGKFDNIIIIPVYVTQVKYIDNTVS